MINVVSSFVQTAESLKKMKELIKECIVNGNEEQARTKVVNAIRYEKLIHAMDYLEYHCDVVIQHVAFLATKYD